MPMLVSKLSRGFPEFNSDLASSEATVRTATYMGAHAEYNLDTSVGGLFAIVPEAGPLRPVGAPAAILLADRGVFAVKP